jgi:hypothetical protein
MLRLGDVFHLTGDRRKIMAKNKKVKPESKAYVQFYSMKDKAWKNLFEVDGKDQVVRTNEKAYQIRIKYIEVQVEQEEEEDSEPEKPRRRTARGDKTKGCVNC